MFKYLLIIIAVILAVAFTEQSVQADTKDFKIFDLKKSLPLTDREKPYYDYYINIGQTQGVEPGKILNVYRRVPVVDAYRNQYHPDMRVLVGRLKIIYSQASMSVGRVWKTSSRNKTPVLEFEKMMVGDGVELTKISDMLNEQPIKRTRKTASAKPQINNPPPQVKPAQEPLPTQVIIPQPVQPAAPVEVNPNKG